MIADWGALRSHLSSISSLAVGAGPPEGVPDVHGSPGGSLTDEINSLQGRAPEQCCRGVKRWSQKGGSHFPAIGDAKKLNSHGTLHGQCENVQKSRVTAVFLNFSENGLLHFLNAGFS